MNKIFTPSVLLAAVLFFAFSCTVNIAKADITSGLVSYFSFNEGSGSVVADSSVSGGSGAITNAVWVEGKLNTALNFNGSSYVIKTSPSSAMKPVSAVTISAWIKSNSTDLWGGDVVSMGDNYALRIEKDGSVKIFYFNGTTWVNVKTAGVNVLDGAWHHIVGQKSGTELLVYTDGALRAKVPDSGVITYSKGANFFIGKHGNGGTNYDFIGAIDDVRVYNTALTAQQILELYNYRSTGSQYSSAILTLSSVSNASSVSSVSVSSRSIGVVDMNPPLGSVSVSAGSAYVNTPSVVLNLSASDLESGVSYFYLSNSSSKPLAKDGFLKWLALLAGWSMDKWNVVSGAPKANFSDSASYSLTGGDGLKTVYAWYKDAVGNISPGYKASTILDTIAPSVSITYPTTALSYATKESLISLSGTAPDATSGLKSVIWINSRGGSGVAYVTTNSWTVENIKLYSGDNIIDVTATDNAGNAKKDTITVNYSAEVVGPGGLISHYLLDESAGSAAIDSAGNNDGTIYGAVHTMGQRERGLKFSGNEYVSIPGLMGMPKSLTLSAWANLDSADTAGTELISIGDYAGIRLDTKNGNGLTGFYYTGSNGWKNVFNKKFYAGEGWHHFVFTVDDINKIQTLYVDGKKAASTNHAFSLSYSGMSGINTIVGRHGGATVRNYDFKGKIDDVRIYNRALSNSEVSSLFNSERSSPDWSGVKYDPFKLVQPTDVRNPVLTSADVTDIYAKFIADPFIFYDNNQWYMFLEVLNGVNSQGDISLAKSSDGIHWTYDKVVLDEPFHLSYPYVFKYDGSYYMIPESFEKKEVRVYKANNFPYNWVPTTIIKDRPLVDSSIFRYNNKWWMFTNWKAEHYLYFSDNLLSGWKEHPKNPIVLNDMSKARDGGRAFVYSKDGVEQIIRIAQKGDITYGENERAFKVTTLTETDFSEQEIPESPILSAGGTGWREKGMHTFDPWWTGNHWLAAVDGKKQSGYDLFTIGIYISPHPSAPESSIVTPSSSMVINQGDSINFSGSATDVDGNNPLSYLWRFGTGSGIPSSNLLNPGIVQFNRPGTFQVTFRATDSNGIYDATPAVRTITVKSRENIIPQSGWKLKGVDSENINTTDSSKSNLGIHAFDGNPNTFWQTSEVVPVRQFPHEIRIDLGATYDIKGFRYLPRQDGNEKGTVKKYRFHVSNDGTTWIWAHGGVFSFDNIENEIMFGSVARGRYVRLTPLSEINGSPFASMAEINLLGNIVN